MKQHAALTAAALAIAATLASSNAFAGPLAKAGASGVGDADSFGRNVKWLGTAFAPTIRLATSCASPGAPAPDPFCVQVTPDVFANFEFKDLASITLPARSTHSLICPSVSPHVRYRLSNTSPLSGVTGAFRASFSYTIESTVLNAPGLVNPETGLPYAGAFTVIMPADVEVSRTLAPGESETRGTSTSRLCVGGLVSREALISAYGLSPAQADAFFANPITIRLNVAGHAQQVQSATIRFGTRFQGD